MAGSFLTVPTITSFFRAVHHGRPFFIPQNSQLKETIMAEPITQPQGDSMPPDITPISEADSLKALETTEKKEED
jgi:hypothetical protein